MEHAPGQFLADLALTIGGGALAGWIARKIGLHPILGYVVAGIVIGPFTPGYVSQTENLSVLSELGLVFLMFTIGLEFSMKEIRKLGMVPLLLSIGAAILIAFGSAAIAAAAHLPNAITLGLVLVVSSTAIGLALLQESGLSEKRMGKLAVSIMIVQDLLAILLLVVIDQPAGELSPEKLGWPLIQTALFVVLSLTVGAALAKRLVVHTLAEGTEDQRVAVFTGIALVAAYVGHMFGLSYAFGAFIAGAVVADLSESTVVEHSIAPFKDLFVLCFFVAIGSLIDPNLLLDNWLLVLGASVGIIAIRWLIWWGFARVIGVGGSTAVLLGIAMIPLGEFNVVLGQSAKAAQRHNATELAVCVGVMFFSIVVATLAQPLVMRLMPAPAAEPPAVAAD